MIESYEKINTTNENQLGEVQCWVNLGFFPIWGFYSEFSARGSKLDNLYLIKGLDIGTWWYLFIGTLSYKQWFHTRQQELPWWTCGACWCSY